MWIIYLTISYSLAQKCLGIHLIDLPIPGQNETEQSLVPSRRGWMNSKKFPPLKPNSQYLRATRHWLFRQSNINNNEDGFPEDEKDMNIKNKIATLVQQTLHDTERKIKSIQYLKDRHREQPPYKIGFILSMVKKARDVLNELFNVAIKHRDQWKALEQLKIFELIVHTNVDTTNLVRQLVEIHIQHLNSTSGSNTYRKRVLLL